MHFSECRWTAQRNNGCAFAIDDDSVLFMWCERLPYDVSYSEWQASTMFFFYFINGVSIHNTCWNQLYLPCSNLYLIQTTWMLLFKAQCTKSIKNVCRQYFVIHKRCGSRALICLSSKEDLHIFIQSKIFYMFVPHIPCWKCSAWTGMFHLSTSCPFFLSCSRIFHALPI